MQYHVYNTMLRQHPEADYRDLRAGSRLFATTVHVLVSALQKVSRVTRLDPALPLYRGLGWDADLPGLFVEADRHGVAGFTEWGFMSTTSRKEVAVHYSKVQEGNPLPRVLRIEVRPAPTPAPRPLRRAVGCVAPRAACRIRTMRCARRPAPRGGPSCGPGASIDTGRERERERNEFSLQYAVMERVG